jgi:hypothetical protein
MNFRMVTLRRAPNGDWFARKAIPADLQDDYKKAHGRALEERFRAAATLSPSQAKQELRDWDATVSGRIEAIRAAHKGEGRSLTKREAHRLAGDWYLWFVDQWEDEPGTPEQWDHEHGRLEDAYARFAPYGADQPNSDDSWAVSPVVRRFVRARVAEVGQVFSFLSLEGVRLLPEAQDQFLDIVEDELVAALALLRRRAGGDYTRDTRPERFPEKKQAEAKASGLDCWALFEAWVQERKPAPATVNRWRSVFMALNREFAGRDIATITNEDALRWKGTLVTEDRSAVVANDVWLMSARTVFGWALANKKIASNPFEDVSVPVPRRVQEVRERAFREPEWQAILRASRQPAPERMTAHHAAARRWVPWLCAYTGARAGEITQLRAEDIQQHRDGLWTLRITPEAGTVKTGKARTVPLHEHLIEQQCPA